MPSTEWFAMPPRFARPKFSLFVVGLITGLAFLALSGAAEQAGAQTTFTCSTATPSNNCAMAITGSATGTTTTPAGLSSSYLTVSGATGPVTSVQVVLNGVTSSIGDWAGYNENNENVYSSVFYTTFVLEDPAGNQLALLGSTGSGYDAMNGVTITIKDGATVAPPLNEPNYGGAWPNTGSITVAPGSYWELENIVPLYDAAPGDLPQTDGSATLTSKFTGATANGTWTLHLADSDQTIDYPLYVTDPVSISGWQLILTYSTLPSTTTTVSSSTNPTYTASTGNSTLLTASVTSSGEPIGGGTVTFTANNSPIACTGGNQTVSGGTATCDAVFTAEGNYSIGASYSGTSSYAPSSGGGLYQLAISHTTNPSTNTYCNPGNLTTTGYTSTDLVYPSYIQVPSGVSQTVANVSVQLNGLQSTNGALSGDVSSSSFLLVSPNETNNLDFLSHGVTGNPQPSVDVTFADGDPLVPNGEGENGGICNGGSGPNCDLQNDTTYGPTDDSLTSDSFITQAGSPAPPSPNYPLPYGSTNAKTFEQAFSGATAAGNWLLYIENDGGIPLSLSGGWCIDLTLNTGAATTTAVTSSKDPAFTGNQVSFTATVQTGGNPVTTGSVTFLDNGEPPTGGNNVITLNGAGQAVFTTSQLTEGDHKISASYGGNSDYNPSQNYVWQRIDDTTAVSGVSGNAAQFCNTGAVLTAEGQTGAFTPNPSNIFVNNLPGTVNTVSLTLDNFYTFSDQIYQIESMVAGPTGAALDFFSNTGASNTVLSSGNYVFTDSASSDVPQTAFGPGSWKPTSYTNIDNTADSFFASASPYYTPPGTFDYAQPHSPAFTLSNVFGSTNPNGTWSLYFDQLLHGSAAGAQNGWCLNFTENPPVVSVVVPSTQTFAQGQQNASFTVDVDNTGPGSTGDPTGGSNPMTVEDGLISVFSYSNFSGTGWSCSANGHLVTCTNDSSVPDGQAYPELTIDVNVSSTASGSYLNSVGVNGAGVGPTPSNNDTITVLANTTTSAFNSETGYGVPAVPLQATVTSSSGAVNSGTVTFTLFSGSTQVGTPTSGAVSNGIAAVFYTLPPGTPPGSYTIQAVYSGSSTFAGSSDSTHTVTMIQAPTTTTASNATTNYSSSPQSVSLSATVTSPVGTVNAGTVTFTVLNGSTPVGTATTSGTVSSGSASVSYTLPAATTIGNYTIQAVYNGSTDFAGSSNNAHTLTVAPSIGSCTTANLNPNPNPESFAAVGDFNGDCRSDILWHNSSTEQVYEWLMNGTTFTGSGSPGSLTSDWVIQNVGDFNADGKADILWRNSTTGEVVIWLMNGTTMTSSTSLGNVSSDWSIAGVGDFNGDGYADILWQNTSGELYLWLMNGTTIAGGGRISNVSSGWNVAGIGDFNGDGDADILWRNSTTGQVYVWLMNGTTIGSMGSPGTPTSDWSIAGVGDFDGDGKSDILWRNSTTGQAYIWFMNGTTFPSSGSIAFVTSDWSIQGVGDYDGSGRAGILWRNSTTNQVYFWLMNGTTIGSTGSPGTPVAAWQIAP